MKIIGDDVIFSTGLIVYANCGIIGLVDNKGELEVSDGYDGCFSSSNRGGKNMTAAEKVELADYMIALWTRYKEEAK